MIKYVEIETSQNVTINHQLASFTDRLIAFLIDLFISSGSALAIFILISVNGINFKGFAAFLSIFIIVFYHLIMEAFAGGRSFGKRFLKIMPVKKNDEPITLKDYLIRWIFLLPDVVLTSGVLASILVYYTSTAQRLGDLVANTVVVKTGGMNLNDLDHILNMNKKQKNYSAQYPQVKKLTDKDILVIKDAIARIESGNNDEASQHVLKELTLKLEVLLEINIAGNPLLILKKLVTDYIYLTR